MKCCVYVRSFLEHPYILFFIEYYINLGFDKIIILKADKIKYDNLEDYKDYIEIHQTENLGNELLSLYTNKISKQYDWVLIVDMDEFLLIKNYKNIKDYINEKINTNNKINTFYFRWAMIEKYDNYKIENFKDIIRNYKIFKNNHIKTMTRVKYLTSVYHPHMVKIKEPLCIYFENKILLKNSAKHLITNSSYNESVLLHIHTRSLNNLIIKSLNTKLKNKQIKSINKFIILINNENENENENENLITELKNCIGAKANIPFSHSKNDEIKIIDEGYCINYFNNNFIDFELEKHMIIDILKKNNINKKKYFKQMKIIEDYVLKRFTNFENNNLFNDKPPL